MKTKLLKRPYNLIFITKNYEELSFTELIVILREAVKNGEVTIKQYMYITSGIRGTEEEAATKRKKFVFDLYSRKIVGSSEVRKVKVKRKNGQENNGSSDSLRANLDSIYRTPIDLSPERIYPEKLKKLLDKARRY